MKTNWRGGGLAGWAFFLGLGPAGLAAQPAWVEVGPVFRGAMQVRVHGASYAQTLGLHTAPAPLSQPASVGPADDYADRTYDDGRVGLDAGTLNPNAIGGPGNTWNWAYDQAAQFDAGTKTLTFHKQGEAGFTVLRDQAVQGDDHLLGAGLQILAGLPLQRSGRWGVDLCIGFQGVWGADWSLTRSPYFERLSRLHVTDTYEVAQTVDPVFGFPGPRTAPGGYDGSPDLPGPVIANRPASRQVEREDLATAESTVRFRFDTDFYELTVGARIRYAATTALSLHATPKLGVCWLDVSARRFEQFVQQANGTPTTLDAWTDRHHELATRVAAGINLGAEMDLGRGWYGGVFGGYEWAVHPLRFGLGPNRVTVEGSGFVAGAALGKRF